MKMNKVLRTPFLFLYLQSEVPQTPYLNKKVRRNIFKLILNKELIYFQRLFEYNNTFLSLLQLEEFCDIINTIHLYLLLQPQIQLLITSEFRQQYTNIANQTNQMLPKISYKRSPFFQLKKIIMPSPILLSETARKSMSIKESHRCEFSLDQLKNNGIELQAQLLKKDIARKSISSEHIHWQHNRQKRYFQVGKSNLHNPGIQQTIYQCKQEKKKRKNAKKHKIQFQDLKDRTCSLKKNQYGLMQICPKSFKTSHANYSHEAIFQKRDCKQHLKNQNENKQAKAEKFSKKLQQLSIAGQVYPYMVNKKISLQNSICLQLKPLRQISNQVNSLNLKSNQNNIEHKIEAYQTRGNGIGHRKLRNSQHVKIMIRQSQKQSTLRLNKNKSDYLPSLAIANGEKRLIYQRIVRKPSPRIVISDSDYLQIKYSVPIKIPEYNYLVKSQSLKKKLRDRKAIQEQKIKIFAISQPVSPYL